MNLLRDAPLWAQLLLIALLVGAAAQDIVQRRISNWLCLAVILAAVAAALAPLLAFILISGGVLALVSLVVRGGRAARHAKGLPYGVAIAVGTAIALLQPTLSMTSLPKADPLDLKAARERVAVR